MENDKQTFNQKMDGYIAAVKTLTQQQIDAIAWCMTGGNSGWTKELLTKELQDEKHDETPDAPSEVIP